jgi:hypothetical protein
LPKKNPSKHPLYEKIKMFKKGPFVVESFVIVGSFDYDCTHLPSSPREELSIHFWGRN